MTWLALALMLQVAQPQIPVQLGVTVSEDTVTVGQRFIAIVRVRAPRGATIEFPAESDSAARSSPTAMQLIGKPAVQALPDTGGTTMSAAYRLAAWDIGPQRLGLGDVVVRFRSQTGYVSLADRGVFVRSVLPADSLLRVPKPPRALIELLPFNWLPWVLLALALAAAALLRWLWIWYRRRRSAPLDPFTAAEREFARIEAMRLIDAGEGEHHAVLMSDVMRDYLAARVSGIERSHTSSEILTTSGPIHTAAHGLGELLWRTDLIKFAGSRVPADEAARLGAAARGTVQSVEKFLVDQANATEQRRAA